MINQRTGFQPALFSRPAEVFPVEPSQLQDLVQLCRTWGEEPLFLLDGEASADPLIAVLKQSIALREAGEAELSLRLLECACQAGMSNGWLLDNSARALLALGRFDEALAIWVDLSQQDDDVDLQEYAIEALNSLRWPSSLLAALENADLQKAHRELLQWLNGMDPDADLGVRELVHELEQRPEVFFRLLPLLERTVQECDVEASRELLHCLKLRCALASITGMFRLSSTTFFVVGCRAASGPIELIAKTRGGAWCRGHMDDLGFQRQDGSINEGWFVILRLQAGESLDELWVNGCSVTWTVQDLRGWPYLDSVEQLLKICRSSQVPLRSLPQLLQSSLGQAMLELCKPLQVSSVWPDFIQRRQLLGRPASEAEITVVIPIYGKWEYIRGHIAGFALDPWFKQGRARVLYVCDDPRLHLLHRWCAMHLAHEELDISVISLRRNMGFGMACNIGVQAAQTPFVCLMNSDVMPIAPEWLTPLHQRIHMNPEQLLAPLLVYDNGLIQHAGMTTEVQDNGCRGFPANIHPFKGLSVQELERNNPDLLPYQAELLSGAMLLFERNRFLNLGGFHPAFGRGDFEDLELSMRWKKHQGELWIVPQAQLMHLERQSMPNGAEESAAWSLQVNAWLAMELCPELV